MSISDLEVASIDAGDREFVRGVNQLHTRAQLGGILFMENFRHPRVTMFNDGSGSASRDNTITFPNGNPSLRLDPQGTVNAGGPGTGPATNGVIVKRRLVNLIKGVYAWEGWARFTSQNNTSGINFTVSNYNRDGNNAYYSRIWLDTVTGASGASNPDGSGLPYVNLLYLNAAGTWVQFGTYNERVADHMWDPFNGPGKLDNAGFWFYWRLTTDFTNQKIVSFQLNDVIWSGAPFPTTPGATQQSDLSGKNIYVAADTGARVMHFSVEYSCSTSTRKFMHVAQLLAEQL